MIFRMIYMNTHEYIGASISNVVFIQSIVMYIQLEEIAVSDIKFIIEGANKWWMI